MSDRDALMNDMEAMMVSEVNETMSQQTPSMSSAQDENTAEREDWDLVVAQGEFYRVLRPEEVPFWLQEDAERHMALLSTILRIPAEPIEWFVPALYDEVPEVFLRHVHDLLTAASDEAEWDAIWSDDECSPRIVDPVYVWREIGVLGSTAQDYSAHGIFLRADMARTGVAGLDYVIAHEMRHRKQAYVRAIGGDLWAQEDERECDADEYAFRYMESVLVGQGGLRLSPALAEAFAPLLAGAEWNAPDTDELGDETSDETDAQSDVA